MTAPLTVDVPLREDQDGKRRIGNTRVLLELVIHAFNRAKSPESIVESCPSLQLKDVYAVLAYYLLHSEEIDAYVRRATAEAERIQREVEAHYSPETARLKAQRQSH